jgi:hypothetical protein
MPIVAAAAEPPLYTSIKGVVFQINAPGVPPMFRRYFGTTDATLTIAARVSYDPIPSCVAELSADQRAYVNGTLMSLLGRVPIVGHLETFFNYDF